MARPLRGCPPKRDAWRRSGRTERHGRGDVSYPFWVTLACRRRCVRPAGQTCRQKRATRRDRLRGCPCAGDGRRLFSDVARVVAGVRTGIAGAAGASFIGRKDGRAAISHATGPPDATGSCRPRPFGSRAAQRQYGAACRGSSRPRVACAGGTARSAPARRTSAKNGRRSARPARPARSWPGWTRLFRPGASHGSGCFRPTRGP